LAKAYIPARSPNDSISGPIWHNLVVCGRYKLSRREQIMNTSIAFRVKKTGVPGTTSHPPQPVPVIRQNPKEPVRKLSLMRWGLIPSWAKDPSVAAGMIDARSETAATKPAFRDSLKSRRCLIPADGFYEWMRTRHDSPKAIDWPMSRENGIRLVSAVHKGSLMGV
jgi:putative SOS response-associated peptidase YedK